MDFWCQWETEEYNFYLFPLKKSQNASSRDVERGLRLDEVGNNEEKQIGTDDDYKKNWKTRIAQSSSSSRWESKRRFELHTL